MLTWISHKSQNLSVSSSYKFASMILFRFRNLLINLADHSKVQGFFEKSKELFGPLVKRKLL